MRSFIGPADLECFYNMCVRPSEELNDGPHFRINKSISQDDFFLLDFMRDASNFRQASFLPSCRKGPKIMLLYQPLFVVLKLLNESASDF